MQWSLVGLVLLTLLLAPVFAGININGSDPSYAAKCDMPKPKWMPWWMWEIYIYHVGQAVVCVPWNKHLSESVLELEWQRKGI